MDIPYKLVIPLLGTPLKCSLKWPLKHKLSNIHTIPVLSTQKIAKVAPIAKQNCLNQTIYFPSLF